MRKLLCILYSMSVLWCAAQTSSTTRKLDENTIVRDSSGTQYPYAVWQKLVQTGEYGLKRVHKKDDLEYILAKLTPQEIHRRDSLRVIREEKMPMPAESKFFVTGEKISVFKTTDMNGNRWDLKELKGKVVVLNFWFVGCPPCRKEIPELNKLVEEYKDNKDVVFIALALDDKYAIQEFIKTTPFNYHIVDGGRYIAEGKYGIHLYPTHVIVDKEGVVRFHTSGYQSNLPLWLRKTIDQSLTTN